MLVLSSLSPFYLRPMGNEESSYDGSSPCIPSYKLSQSMPIGLLS